MSINQNAKNFTDKLLNKTYIRYKDKQKKFNLIPLAIIGYFLFDYYTQYNQINQIFGWTFIGLLAVYFYDTYKVIQIVRKPEKLILFKLTKKEDDGSEKNHYIACHDDFDLSIILSQEKIITPYDDFDVEIVGEVIT